VSLAAGYMTQRMTVTEPGEGEPDIWGNRPLRITPDVPCRVDYGNRLIRTATGEQVASRASVITCYPVKVGALLTLPGEDPERPLTVLEVRIVSGLGGAEDHREVYL
jgi:hypothetical protein